MDDINKPADARLVSLDVFRGIIMFLLIAETARVYRTFHDAAPEGSLGEAVIAQFHHHPWHGLHFWDLVQPFFMFIVGVAMAFSIAKRTERGHSWKQNFGHILYRCFMLLLFGVGLHCIYAGELRWELWNVLSQLSVTILIAFLIMRWPAIVQITIAAALILATETFYRGWPVEGFDQAFVKGENFGSWMDMLLMRKVNSDGWVAVNCLPTAAHTIWGVVAGQLLLSDRPPARKIGWLVSSGVLLLAIGYGLDLFGFSPIIKRICTSSFVIVSGGWALLALALLYWLVDIVGLQRWGFLFLVVGMNPIFIYLLSESLGRQWMNGTVAIFTNGALQPLGVNETGLNIVAALTVLALQWCLCLWLYQRKLLIRI